MLHRESLAPVDARSEELIEIVLDQVAGLGVERSVLRDEVRTLVDEIVTGTVQAAEDLDAVIAARIADIETLVSAQVNEVLHAPAFQSLESAWRGLRYLVDASDPDAPIEIRVLDVSKKELLSDLERSPEFDQSALFVKVYEEEYGMLGGEPFGLLVGDYHFDASAPDLALLERIAAVAAAAHAPFLSAAAPAFFGWESWRDLQSARRMARLFESPEYTKWNSFRQTEDARYVGLVLPRVLLREPYRGQASGARSFHFEEDFSTSGAEGYLFGNGSFVFAGRVCASFARYRWCASIRGVEDGLVDDLVALDFGTDSVGVAVRGPTETDIGDLREKELADLGFIPILHAKDGGSVVIYSAQSCQAAKLYDTDEASANARLATQLQYTLSVSRFAHYLKVIARDKAGSFLAASECEDYLNRWISGYCLGNPEGAGQEERARKPLRDARVEVRASRSAPGNYEAVFHLLPHFQLDELTASLRLVTALPKVGRAAAPEQRPDR